MDLKKLLPKGDLTPLNNRKGTEVGEMKKEKEKRRADCLWLFFCLLPRMRQRIKRQTSRQIPSSRETFGWWCCESGKNPGGRNGIRRSGAGSRAVTAAAAVPRSPHRCAWRLRATHSQQPLVLHPSPWGPAALQPAGCPHVKPPNVPTNPSPTHSGAWQTGLPTYIGWGAEGELISRPFRGGVARGFVPYCTDRVPAPSVWLSPRDPLQLPVYKKGEWISPGCQVCLTCGHGHCPRAPETQLSLVLMYRRCRTNGCRTPEKLCWLSWLHCPAEIWEEEKRGRQGSEKGQDTPETCMSPFPRCTSSFEVYMKLHTRRFWKQENLLHA